MVTCHTTTVLASQQLPQSGGTGSVCYKKSLLIIIVIIVVIICGQPLKAWTHHNCRDREIGYPSRQDRTGEDRRGYDRTGLSVNAQVKRGSKSKCIKLSNSKWIGVLDWYCKRQSRRTIGSATTRDRQVLVFICLLFYLLATSKVISRHIPICDSAHSWQLYGAA